ncbi:MAG: TonB-dependent receptor [Bacteroides sp.]|nr:TonB-dependent receptor [Bacteroides sp.]
MNSYKTLTNRLSRRGYLTLLALLVMFTAWAQEVTVNGVVVDEMNEPLIGATIQVKNTAKGVVTDFDGKFSISVQNNATLVISYIGYQAQEIKIKGQKSFNIKMEPDNAMLDEVVVVGYGSMKKSDLTGSVSSVSSKSIEGFKTASVMEALGGQIAGVQITQSDGTPGSVFDIKIRGVGTVNGDASPLYIVDGFEVGDIDYLANSDIESIEVLKDASASAIYGARAANGVVLVTTKSGKEGKPVITYNGSASYRNISKQLDLLNPYEFVRLQTELNATKYENTYYQEGEDADGNPYIHQTLDDYLTDGGLDWQKEAFNSTWSQNHDVSMSGGTKETKYAISFSHFDENGIFTNSGYKKNSGKLRINQKLSKRATFDATINYANTVKNGIGTSGTGGTLNVLSNLLRARPTGGNNLTNEELLESVFDPLELESGSNYSQINPIKQAEAVKDRRQSELWGANASLTVELIKGLTFKAAATYNTTNTRRDIFYGENSSQAYRGGGVYGSTQMTKELRWQSSNTLTYKRKINKKNSFDVMLGHEYAYRSTEYLYGQAKDFPFANLGNDNLGIGATPSSVSTSKSDKRLLSFFARANYNFDNRYLFTATMRADGSSVFSAKNKWGYFPSFSAAWRVSEEAFMKNLKAISNLKLRLGWGTVGNDRITNYLSLDLYSSSKYGVGQTQTTVLASKQLPNKNLKWEGSTTTNVGIDLGLFENRVNLTADFFVKNTKDLLLAQKLAYVSGFSSQWQNIGKIQNKGIELKLNTTNIQSRDFLWQTDFNISFIKNTLKSLQDGTSYIQSATSFNSNFSGNDYISVVGSALGDMYGYVFDGVYQTSDFNVLPDGTMQLKPGVTDISTHAGKVEPGMVKYKDITGDGKITTDDRTSIGNGQPDWYGGITNTFNWKGVDFSFMFQFSYGNDVYNATRMFNTQSQDERSNQLAEVADRWTTTHASNLVPSAKGYIKYELYSRFIEDGSYLRLKNVTLGYTLPTKWTKKIYINRLRLYGTAQNLFCLTKYSGYDPEVNMKNSPLMPGFDWGAYPKSRVFTFGVEVQF